MLFNKDSCKLFQSIEYLGSNETGELWLSQPISYESKKFRVDRRNYLMLMGKVSYGGLNNLSYGRDVEIITASKNLQRIRQG